MGPSRRPASEIAESHHQGRRLCLVRLGLCQPGGGRILRLEPPLRSRLGALHERVHSRAPGHVEDCLALTLCIAVSRVALHGQVTFEDQREKQRT